MSTIKRRLRRGAKRAGDAIVGAVAVGLLKTLRLIDPDTMTNAAGRFMRTIGPFEVVEITDLAKVALVGAGMRSHPGVTARMFRTLADEQINLRMISTSPITISCLIPRADLVRAVGALQVAFGVDSG